MDWININDKQPETTLQKYLVCLENCAVVDLWYSDMRSDDCKWFHPTNGYKFEQNPVKYWMPFPEPPESCDGETNNENSGLHKHIVTAMLPFLEEMSKHENEQLGKLLTPYKREKHANNKYCIAIVKELIESRFGN